MIEVNNNVLGDLDIVSITDFPLAITKGIVNLDNLKARTGTYTKTFKVPSTKNNVNLLSNVDNINSRKDYRDALNRKPCVVYVNGGAIEQGFIQVSKVFNGFELDSFELVFFGNNIDWVKKASEQKLSSLTYRSNTQVYDVDSIETANFSDVDTYDHNYPYISRGGNQGANTAQVRDFYPCFYIKGLLETGLNALGWNINSDFLNNDDIKTLTADLNGDMRVNKDVVDDSKTRATTTGDQIFYQGTPEKMIFQNDSTPPNKDVNGNYNNATGIYTAPSTGRYNITFSLNTDNWFENSSSVSINAKMCVGTGDTFRVDTFVKDDVSKSVITTSAQTTTFNLSAVAIAGELITIFIDYTPFSFASEYGTSKIGTYFNIQRSSVLEEGDDFSLNEIIPANIKLLDVINDITRMFNLYYWTDINTKTIYIEPRDTFFKAPSEAIDWTNKLDISKKNEIDYVRSYKRDIVFSYKDVNNDEWLKKWQDTNKRVYAKYTHTLPERFGEGTTEIKLDLFSASYAHVATEVTPIQGSSFNSNLSPTTLKYWNEYLTNIGDVPSKRIESYNPRIFFFEAGFQTSLDGTQRLYNLNNSTTNFIPYGVFQDYNNTTSPRNLSFTGDDGLFSSHYSNMLKNIEEGGRFVGYFNLSSTDIKNLDFRKLVYLDYPLNVRGYYLVEVVSDYKPVLNTLTKVSLFKFENLGSVPIDESQEGNNGNDDDNGNQTPSPEPIYVEDGSNLIEVFWENPVTGLLEPVYR